MSFNETRVLIRYIRRMVKEPCTKEVRDWEYLQAFADRGDAAAFEILIHRHGPTVLHVCRRVLGDEHADRVSERSPPATTPTW